MEVVSSHKGRESVDRCWRQGLGGLQSPGCRATKELHCRSRAPPDQVCKGAAVLHQRLLEAQVDVEAPAAELDKRLDARVDLGRGSWGAGGHWVGAFAIEKKGRKPCGACKQPGSPTGRRRTSKAMTPKLKQSDSLVILPEEATSGAI